MEYREAKIELLKSLVRAGIVPVERRAELRCKEPFDTQACTPEHRQELLAKVAEMQHQLNREKKFLSRVTKSLLK